MKRISRLWTNSTRLARILLVLLLASYQGCGGGGGGGGKGGAAPAPAGAGNVEIALADSPSSSFQQLTLNVVSVRFNPSTNLNISESDKQWETILPQPPSSGLSPNEAIIDLNSLAMLAQIFGTGRLKTKTFGQVELVLDPIAPGSVVPVCSPAVFDGLPPLPGEGCISYPMKLLKSGTNLRAAISLKVKSNQLSTLVLDITPTIVSIPADSNGSYTIDPTMTVALVNNFLATVSGTVVKGATNSEKITAEIAGTNQIVITVGTQANGTFTFGLPAVAAGTAYDLFASGPNTSLVALANKVFTPGATSLGDLKPHKPQAGATLSGTIVDKCTGAGIQGVTLDVLTPATTGADCTKAPPTGCVVVATGATTAGGSYQVPSVKGVTPPPFNQIPAGMGTKYTLRISASGYDSVITAIDSATTILKCPDSGATDKKCNFSLTRGQINGNVKLAAMNTGSPLDVLVMAEQSNTNNIAAVTTVTIPTGSTLAPFTLLVPTNKTVVATTLDLFASAKDQFGGKPEQATGHTIAVLPGVMPPDMVTACTTPVLSSDLGPMACVGHGSVSGMAPGADQNTTIVLSKSGVQLMQSQVGPGAAYNFCAPADTYKLQRFESGIPGSSTIQPLTGPSLISTPCSSICAPAAPGKCFLCANTPGPTLP
jgi:Domain of unknown function (DUF4382)